MEHKRINVLNLERKTLPSDVDEAAAYFYFCPYCRTEVVGGAYYFNPSYYNMNRAPKFQRSLTVVCPNCNRKTVDHDKYMLTYRHFPHQEKCRYYFDPFDSNLCILELKKESADQALSQNDNLLELGSIGTFECIYEHKSFDNNHPLINNAFKYLQLKRQEGNRPNIDGVVALAESQQICPQAVDSTGIKNDPEKLRDYINHLINLEAAIHSCKLRLSKLYYDRVSIIDDLETQNAIWARSAGAAEKERARRAKQRIEELKAGKIEVPFTAPQKPSEPAEPTFKQAGLFNKRIIQAENDEIQKAYEEKIKCYENALQNYKEDLNEYKKQVEEWLSIQIKTEENNYDLAQRALEDVSNKKPSFAEDEEKRIVDTEIAEAEETLKNLIKGKNELYSLNIVFGKYRDFVALSSIYEYLISGRCSSLEGPNGAYNLYESEIRANQIISQLSDILKSLEQIKKNQYMVYSVLKSIDFELAALNSTATKALNAVELIGANTSSIAQNSAVIAYNTEQTAFYAKKNSELADALGFLVALK